MKLHELIELYRVSVKAPNEDSINILLKEISLSIVQGEWISIVGKNGSGKSTLAQLLTGNLMPYSGTMRCGFSGQMPFPFVMQQEVQWFGETPWEDMVFLLESRGENPDLMPVIIQRTLALLGIEYLKDRPYAEMSGGQKQLSVIAGCLVAEPPLLLFDEASSMLDSRSRQQVLEAAKLLNKQGTTIIWLTHQMEDLSYGQRVIVLEDRQIRYDDSTCSFFYDSTFSDNEELIKGLISPCEQFGFGVPYPVQVAHDLIKHGMRLKGFPLTSRQLVEAVNGLGR